MLCGNVLAVAQVPKPAESPWRHVAILDSVSISYLMYREADNANNGVVVKLNNLTDQRIAYSFGIVFRGSEGREELRSVFGELNPHEMKTGEMDGLFWIPFDDGTQLSEVGFRGFKARSIGIR